MFVKVHKAVSVLKSVRRMPGITVSSGNSYISTVLAQEMGLRKDVITGLDLFYDAETHRLRIEVNNQGEKSLIKTHRTLTGKSKEKGGTINICKKDLPGGRYDLEEIISRFNGYATAFICKLRESNGKLRLDEWVDNSLKAAGL